MKTTLQASANCDRKQTGISLVIALIALVALTLAGLALVRSVDTGNLISGNFAFRQSALHTTDVGVEAAITALNTIVTTSKDKNYPASCASGACSYYALKQTTDTSGVPAVIDWANVPATTVDSSYTVQYVIDRLCEGALPVTDVAEQCMNTMQKTVSSNAAGHSKFSSADLVYYRVTVRVAGPRNTVSFVQSIYAR